MASSRIAIAVSLACTLFALACGDDDDDDAVAVADARAPEGGSGDKDAGHHPIPMNLAELGVLMRAVPFAVCASRCGDPTFDD